MRDIDINGWEYPVPQWYQDYLDSMDDSMEECTYVTTKRALEFLTPYLEEETNDSNI